MKKGKKLTVISFLLSVVCLSVYAESVTNNLDINGGFIYNHGAINPGDIGMTFTNEGIRDVTVSAGQLSGVDPETGAIITNAANLLSLKAKSLTAVSNIVTGGRFIGDGSGLTNLNVDSLSGSISAASLPTSGVWNAAGVTITNATLADSTQTSLTITSNLTVQGTISGNGSGLTGVTAAAGGNDGELQFNDNGTLAGNTNFFMHPTEHKLAFRSPSGNFFRGYNSETISDNNLIYSVRNENGTSVLRLRENGQDTIRLSGDGTAYIKGTLKLDGQLIADGSGLTNLPVQSQVDALIAAVSSSPAATITTNQIASWNSGGNLATTVQVSTGTVSVTTNLTVQGTISGNGSGLSSVAAGGNNGELQFNENGVLAGNTNFFMHPTEHKLAFRSQSGNIFRAYNSESITDSNLIYSLRNEDGTSVLRLRKNGEDTIRLSGDGTAYIKGNLQLDGQLIADGSGLTNLTAANITGTIPVEQIPVASTNSSGLLTAADKQKLDTISTNGIPGDTSGCVLLDGSRPMTGDLDLNGHKIRNLADAASDNDAASQGHVKTMMQQVPEYGDLSMGEFTSQVATPDRPVPTVIHTADIADSAITTAKLDDGVVTPSKMDQIPSHTVLGNMTNDHATPTTIEVKDEDDMASDSATALASQRSIKTYVDTAISNFIVRARIDANGTVLNQVGVASVTKLSTGIYRITFAVPADYAITATIKDPINGTSVNPEGGAICAYTYNQSTNSVEIRIIYQNKQSSYVAGPIDEQFSLIGIPF